MRFHAGFKWNGTEFVAVPGVDRLGLAANKFNTTTFPELTTSRLRLEMDSEGRSSTGILEWRVRWSNRHDHEGYQAGYFIEAGIAHYLATGGKDPCLFEAGRRLADCWVNHIGPAPKRAWFEVHQELEQALLRFARFVEEKEGAGRGRRYVQGQCIHPTKWLSAHGLTDLSGHGAPKDLGFGDAETKAITGRSATTTLGGGAGAGCVFRRYSDTDSDLIRTGFRLMSDSVPESAGQDSGPSGQFLTPP